MLPAVPWVVLALTLALLVAREKPEVSGKLLDPILSRLGSLRTWALVGLFLVLVVSFVKTNVATLDHQVLPVAIGIAVTFVGLILGGWLVKDGRGSQLAGVGLAGLAFWATTSVFNTDLANSADRVLLVLTAALLTGLALWTSGAGLLTADILVVLFAAVSSSLLMLARNESQFKVTPLVYLGCALVAGCVAYVLTIALKKSNVGLTRVLASIVAVGGAWLLADKAFAMGSQALLVAAGGLAALVCGWLIPTPKASTNFRWVVSAMVFVGVATYAFNADRALGMSMALLGAVLVSVIMGLRHLLPAIAPLAALTFARVFREVYPDASKAFDIGQHYAVVGLILGVLLVLAGIEFWRSMTERNAFRNQLAAVTAGLLGVAIAGSSILILDSKGTVGLVIGLGLAPLFAALSDRNTQGASIWSMALMGLVTLAYSPITSIEGLERTHKVKLFAILAGVGLVIALVTWFLARPAKRKEVV